MKILLIEDNPVDQMFVKQSLRQLEGFEYELTACESLTEAKEHLKTSQFDVVLLDLWLPDSEGLETCQRLVAAVPDLPVVVMTATDDRRLAKEAIHSGAQDYLVKGTFPGAAIVRVLQYSIDRHHFHRELAVRENHFLQVANHVPAIIWTTNSNLELTSVLGAGLALLNLDSRQLVGKTLDVIFHDTGEAEGALHVHREVLNGRPMSFETDWLERTFEVKIDPFYELEGSRTGTIGVALDVTERKNLSREIHFARLVQEALLPAEHPQLKGFEIFGASYPARQACGDWFDYLVFPDGSLGLVVGDVSGKGFGPAMLSATMVAYLEALVEVHSDISEILSLCNHIFHKRSQNPHFAVLSLGQLNSAAQTLIYGGAGEGMLIMGSKGQIKHHVPSSGLPLGLFDQKHSSFQAAEEIALDAGDILLLLTDGFREAYNRNHELFGEARIVETVAAHRQDSASVIMKALKDAVGKFCDGQPQQDDMTGIIVKVLET